MYLIKAYDPVSQTYDTFQTCSTREQCDEVAYVLANVLLHNHLHVAGTNRNYSFLVAVDYTLDRIVQRYSAYWARLVLNCGDEDNALEKARVLNEKILRETDRMNSIPSIPEDELYWNGVSSVGI